MKVKKYEVILTNPEAIHVTSHLKSRDIEMIFSALDSLWSDLDFEEWTLEISPYYEEVSGDA